MVVLVASLVVVLFVVHRLVIGYPRPPARYRVIGTGEAAFLAAAASSFFPPGGALALSGADVDLPGYVDRYLAQLPARQRWLIRALLLLFEQSTIVLPARGLGAFRRFSSMSPDQRQSVLRGWAESRLYPRRMAFTALKAIAIMGYFGHPDCLERLGLTPFEIATPVCEADLLYPPIGRPRTAIPWSADDLTEASDGRPLRGVA